MKNLQAYQGGYRYSTAEVGELIEVEVEYMKNGRRRGVIVCVTPKEVKDGCVSFTLFSGFSLLVLPLARMAPKKVQMVAELIDPIAVQVAQLYAAGQKDGAKLLISNAVAKLGSVAA